MSQNYTESPVTLDIKRTHTVAVKFLQLSTVGSRYPSKTNELQSVLTSKRYHYLTHNDNVRVGDFGVVMSPVFNAPALVEIVEFMPNFRSHMAFKYLIDIVDFTDYNKRLEAEALEREWRANQLRRKNEIERSLAEARQRAESAFIENYLRSDSAYQSLQSELQHIKDSLG
jgi:hypothetical protein